MGRYTFDLVEPQQGMNLSVQGEGYKTVTTGEGGMVACRSAAVHERAKAWHDHGHENNPALPRWEDSRSGSGFNYRMSELPGAVGPAQPRNRDAVIEGQRRTSAATWDPTQDLPGIRPRR